MRLRTEMKGGAIIHNGVFPFNDCSHDAMAAHALMRAIKEWWDRPDDGQCADGAVTWIEKRAAEILAGWLGEERNG